MLDPFLGSGSTAVAARSLGRHYLGVEINSEYVELAQERLYKTQAGLQGLADINGKYSAAVGQGIV